MDFGEALAAIKSGKRVGLPEFGGYDSGPAYLQLDGFTNPTPCIRMVFPGADEGGFIQWAPRVGDVMREDWEIVPA